MVMAGAVQLRVACSSPFFHFFFRFPIPASNCFATNAALVEMALKGCGEVAVCGQGAVVGCKVREIPHAQPLQLRAAHAMVAGVAGATPRAGPQSTRKICEKNQQGEAINLF